MHLNDITAIESVAYLIKYDSVHGAYRGWHREEDGGGDWGRTSAVHAPLRVRVDTVYKAWPIPGAVCAEIFRAVLGAVILCMAMITAYHERGCAAALRPTCLSCSDTRDTCSPAIHTRKPTTSTPSSRPDHVVL